MTRRDKVAHRIASGAAPPVLVTGGTGTLGRLVVERLRHQGRAVRVLSRGRRDAGEGTARADAGIDHVTADLSTGEGVAAAIEGIEIVVHAAGTAKGDEDKARHLVTAAKQARVRHLVFISVVGADRIPAQSGLDRAMFGYFASKLAAERVVAGSGLLWSTLRATQFHDLLFTTVRGMARMPVVPVPAGFQFQPIDVGDVADKLVELTLGTPAGLAGDIGGPRVYAMAELVRTYLQAAGKRRPIVQLPVPGKAAAAIRAGANLTPDRAVGSRTWEDFLTSRLARPPLAALPQRSRSNHA
jgi:uncharacterized protein YbjT (DUF2867 family)